MFRRLPDALAELRSLWAIAWPMLIAQVSQMATGVVDTIMAARYSATDLAAIAIGYNIWLPVFLLFIGVMLGSTTLIAQDFGAGRLQSIRDALPQALWLALALGLLGGPLIYHSGPLLDLLDLDATTHRKSLDYLQATAYGLPAAALFQALRCHIQGIGVMRPFAVASVIGFLANIPLNYAFIYGRWGAPELGAAGCGWATAMSMWLTLLVMTGLVAHTRRLHPYLPARWLVAPRPDILRAIAHLGLPMGLSFFLEVAVFAVIALFIATLGNAAIAAHQIAFNVWDLVYMFLISVGAAMATRVGHAIGAGDRARVHLAIACGAAVIGLIGALGMTALLAAPERIIGLYTNEAAIADVATALIGLAALFILIDATQITATFCLRAFKDTRFPFVVLCGCYWLVTLPLGYWLGIRIAGEPLQGTMGFWKAMIAGIALSTVILLGRLARTLRAPLPPVPGPPTVAPPS